MVTGASNCDLAIILIDARAGVKTQTRRHSFLVSLLGIKHVIVTVNKMDLKDYSETVYDDINADDFRFPVQYVNRPNLNFRGFADTVVSGQIKHGDRITALPSGK